MEQTKAKKEKKYNYKFKLPGILKVAIAALVVLAQLGGITYIAMAAKDASLPIHYVFQFVGLFMVLFVVRHQRSAAYSVPWIIILLMLPVAGVIFYILWGRQSIFRRSRKFLNHYIRRTEKLVPSGQESLSQLPHLKEMQNLRAPVIPIEMQNVPPGLKLREFASEQNIPKAYYQLPLSTRLLTNWGFPLYQGQILEYFPNGESQFTAMFEDLKNAKNFILAEYYIINEGKIWETFRDICIQKAKEGVEVRLLYDDFGCAPRLTYGMLQPLIDAGVDVRAFNPILRYTSRMYINYRNHQKLCIIDGDVSYLSGTNLADEYANIYPKHGHWKDCALKITGAATWAATNQFFMMWRLAGGEEPLRLKDYMPPNDLFPQLLPPTDLSEPPQTLSESIRNQNPDAHMIPFWDGPVNNPHNIGEQLYISVINEAKSRLYITTPYFVVDEKMLSALSRSAASGVDVRILMPGIADKKSVNIATKSFYEELLRNGVRVFEYTPGFNHDKTVVADGTLAVTGSLNFDFRSFNLNYENGALLYKEPVIQDMERDLLNSFELSNEVNLEMWMQRPWYTRMLQSIVRIFSPLI